MGKKLEELVQQGTVHWTSALRFRFLTVTLAPRADDRAAVYELHRSFRKLLRHKRIGWARDYTRDHSFGAIAHGEKAGTWHMHAMIWGRFVPQATLQEVWREITGDSYIVDIREIHTWQEGLREVLKYITKLAEPANPDQSRDQEPVVDVTRLVDLYFAYRGRHRLVSYGVFHHIDRKVKPAKVRCASPYCEAIHPDGHDPARLCERCRFPWHYVECLEPEWLDSQVLYEFLYDRPPPSVG